jgi:hypothetical protein
MVDKQENILVEFDYNNIIVIDPNKIIDENGNAKPRLVQHENLVMYANLECNLSQSSNAFFTIVVNLNNCKHKVIQHVIGITFT